MKVRFVYAGFKRHAEEHPELLEHVPCDEYFGPPSLGIASIAACTPPGWELDFRDDRLEDVGIGDDVDLVAISSFTPSGKRALALADAFRAAGTPVVMGGIFPTTVPEEAAAHADAIVIGEGETVWPRLLEDAKRGALEARYRAPAPIDPTTLPVPRVDLYFEKEGHRFRPDDYPVQVQRGCPMTCSACAIPASMGRFVRPHSTDQVVAQIEQLERNGKLASFTEDTSFFPGGGAMRRFRELLHTLAERGREAPVSYVGISMPLILATKSEVLSELRRAGVRMFYLVGGFDPITRRAFTGNDDRALTRAYETIAKCHDHDIEPYTSFLVGNDDDDEGVFDRMLDFADRANIAKAEFAIRTPYPGTPMHATLRDAGRLLHTDWARYNDANVVFEPAQMSPERLLEGYLHLWKEFYRSRQSLSKLEHRVSTIQF